MVDAFVDGRQSGIVILTDLWRIPVPSRVRFYGGEERTVIAHTSIDNPASSSTLTLDAPVTLPDNAGIWTMEGVGG